MTNICTSEKKNYLNRSINIHRSDSIAQFKFLVQGINNKEFPELIALTKNKVIG